MAEGLAGLAIRSLSVRFGGISALDDVDLDVARSGVAALVSR